MSDQSLCHAESLEELSLSDSLGVVVIGRNEGKRLRHCLASITPWTDRVVYVDSASTDDSVKTAKQYDVQVVELDANVRLTAARGRAVGTQVLLDRWPQTPFLFFVDGDCEVDRAWPETAVRVLRTDPRLAVVCGRTRESDPEFSAYNRLMDIEWDRPAGETEACGGGAVMRTAAVIEVGGFDPTVVAGEEPELCWRLRQRGWRIRRLADEMTRHDAAIRRFGQWWRREIRSGFGSMDVWSRTGARRGGPFWSMIRRGIVWSLVLPLLMLLAICGSWLIGRPMWSVGIIVVVVGLHLISAGRVMYRYRRAGMRLGDALLGAWISIAAKWGQAIGYGQWCWERAIGRTMPAGREGNVSPGETRRSEATPRGNAASSISGTRQ